jgi:transposase
MLKMETVHVIRHLYYNEKKSQRAIARALGIHRRTVRKYLTVSEPVRVESGPRPQPVLAVAGPRIEAVLSEWATRIGGKHQITAQRLHRQLQDEGLGISARTVRRYLAEKKRQAAEVFVPLVHRAGDEAQVDFFELLVDVQGVRRKAHLFLLRLMHSGRDFVWLYDRCDQVSFLDGHVRAFAFLGGVPRRGVYDNLSAAVRRRVGVHRELTERFRALSSHYGFEPCFARVGEGHDKGGVEGRGKAIRLNYLTPIEQGEYLCQISERLQVRLDRDWERGEAREGLTPSERFATDRAGLLALPATAFEARALQVVSVSRSATVRLEAAWYSVPSTWAGLEIKAWIGPEEVLLRWQNQQVLHPRRPPGSRSVDYNHYLRELARKPQALRQVAPELLAGWGEPFTTFWKRLGEDEGCAGSLPVARRFASVLWFVLEHGLDQARTAVRDALAAGRLDLLSRSATERGVLQEQAVPAQLRQVQVEAAEAKRYDLLLAEAS